MNNTLTLLDAVKEELCSKYGLVPEQIRLELNIHNVEQEKTKEILTDYAKYPGNVYYGKAASFTLTTKGIFDHVTCFHPTIEEEEIEIG
jgi:hypothetical protein